MGRTKLSAADGRAYFLSRFLNIAVAAVLVGCSQPEDTLPYPLIISQEGLGAIHPAQAYNFHSLNSALPGFELVRLDAVSGEQAQHLILLKRGSSEIARIFISPDQKKIEEIFILSAQIKNRDGKGIGDILPVTATLKCQSLTCRYIDEPSLSYTIEPSTHRIIEISYQKL